jgi:hypothetical protein
MTRAALLALLGVAALALLALIGVEFTVSPADQAETIVKAEPEQQAQPKPKLMNADRPRTNEWAAITLARPLFSVNRQPESAGPKTAVSADHATIDLPRLSGILVVGDQMQAMFQPLGDTPPLVLVEGQALGHEGEALADWRVEKISRTEVTLLSPMGETVLEPKFDENAPPPPPPQPVLQRVPPPNASQLRGGPPIGQVNQQNQPNQPPQRANPAQNQGQFQRPGAGPPGQPGIRPPFPRTGAPPNGTAVPPGVR